MQILKTQTGNNRYDLLEPISQEEVSSILESAWPDLYNLFYMKLKDHIDGASIKELTTMGHVYPLRIPNPEKLKNDYRCEFDIGDIVTTTYDKNIIMVVYDLPLLDIRNRNIMFSWNRKDLPDDLESVLCKGIDIKTRETVGYYMNPDIDIPLDDSSLIPEKLIKTTTDDEYILKLRSEILYNGGNV